MSLSPRSLHSKVSRRQATRGVRRAQPAQRNQSGCEQVATSPRVNAAFDAFWFGGSWLVGLSRLAHALTTCAGTAPGGSPHRARLPCPECICRLVVDTALRHAMQQSMLCATCLGQSSQSRGFGMKDIVLRPRASSLCLKLTDKLPSLLFSIISFLLGT